MGEFEATFDGTSEGGLAYDSSVSRLDRSSSAEKLQRMLRASRERFRIVDRHKQYQVEPGVSRERFRADYFLKESKQVLLKRMRDVREDMLET